MVLYAWRFCEGWNPEKLPLAVAFYEIEDIDLLVMQLLALRDTMNAHQAAQRK